MHAEKNANNTFTPVESEKVNFLRRICTRSISIFTKSVVSSASGEWQELKLFLAVLLGLGQDDPLW